MNLFNTYRISCCLFLLVSCSTTNQGVSTADIVSYSSEPPEVVFANDEILNYAERMPRFKDGIESVYKKVYYPPSLRKNYVEGKVVVEFVVYKDGRIGPVKVVSSPHPELGQVAVDALQGTLFEPAIHYGKVVNVLYTMPFEFRVED